MNNLLIKSAFLSALCLVFVASQAFCATGDFKVSTSFKTKSVEYRPGNSGVASDTDSEVYSLAVNYGVTDKLSLTGTYSKTEMDSDRADGVVTDTDTDTFGITAIYKLNRSFTAFANYTYGETEVDSVVNPFTDFDFDLDLNLFLAGVTYAKVFDRQWLLTLTPTISYADSNISDYIIRNAGIPVDGDDTSVTTFSLASSISYIFKNGVVGLTYTHNQRSEGEDKSFGKLQLGATYRFNETVSVSAHVAEDIAREDIRGREFGFKFNIKI